MKGVKTAILNGDLFDIYVGGGTAILKGDVFDIYELG